MATIGRNDPCPCGSGKKYKKCCMPKHTAVDLQAYRESRAEESLRGEILRFSTGARFKDEMVEAFTKYHRGKIDTSLLLNQDPVENIRFLDWFINDHVHTKENKRIIDLFGELRSKNLDEEQKKLLEEWKGSRLGAFEVESTEGGVLKLAELFGDNTHSIEDQSACDELKAGQILVVRVTSSWGKKELAGAPTTMPAEAKQEFIDSINGEFEKYREDNPDSEMSQFLSENTHLLTAAALELSTD